MSASPLIPKNYMHVSVLVLPYPGNIVRYDVVGVSCTIH